MEYWSDGNWARRAWTVTHAAVRGSAWAVLRQAVLPVWRCPRLAAWAAGVAGVWFLLRLPFAWISVIPHHVDFSPGIALVPLSGVVMGPGGAWGCAAGSLLSDAVLGRLDGISFFRAGGFFFFALGTERLWHAFRRRGPVLEGRWWEAAVFALVMWPGCFLAAAWRALGSEMLRFYPFAYVAGILLLMHLLFCTLVGVPLYPVVHRLWVGRFGTWREMAGAGTDDGAVRFSSALLVLVGGVAACLAGLLASRVFYNVGFLQPAVLGTSTGVMVPLAVIPFLLVHGVGVFRD